MRPLEPLRWYSNPSRLCGRRRGIAHGTAASTAAVLQRAQVERRVDARALRRERSCELDGRVEEHRAPCPTPRPRRARTRLAAHAVGDLRHFGRLERAARCTRVSRSSSLRGSSCCPPPTPRRSSRRRRWCARAQALVARERTLVGLALSRPQRTPRTSGGGEIELVEQHEPFGGDGAREGARLEEEEDLARRPDPASGGTSRRDRRR